MLCVSSLWWGRWSVLRVLDCSVIEQQHTIVLNQIGVVLGLFGAKRRLLLLLFFFHIDPREHYGLYLLQLSTCHCFLLLVLLDIKSARWNSGFVLSASEHMITNHLEIVTFLLLNMHNVIICYLYTCASFKVCLIFL